LQSQQQALQHDNQHTHQHPVSTNPINSHDSLTTTHQGHIGITILISSAIALLSLLLSLFLVSLTFTIDIATAQPKQLPQPQTAQGLPVVIVPAITGNILVVVYFLIGTSSFILGLRIQSAARTTTTTSSSV
jgi:uncharacterized membrane protein